MLIKGHMLVATGASDDIHVEYRPDDWGPEIKPEIGVIHYAVTQDADTTARVLGRADYLSAHLAVGRAGKGHVIQQVPFNRQAYHAGKSSWRGRPSCNGFSLGIEIANPGPVFRRPDGSWKDVHGKEWKGGVVEARHRSGLPAHWTHWAEYDQVELDIVAHIVELWRQTYGLVDVVGHDEIAPGRKSDPGPAFPMTWLKGVIFPGREKVETP